MKKRGFACEVVRVTEIDALRNVASAARRLMQYEVDGAPDYLEWDAYFSALYEAISALDA